MKTEKIVISFMAVLIGILVAGAAFYFYQKTKVILPSQTKVIKITPPTPTPLPSIFLTINSPKNEEVVDTKTISINGKTTTDAVVVISTNIDDQAINPAQNGNFSTTVSLQDGANIIAITAIAPNGEEISITKTITYSKESF